MVFPLSSLRNETFSDLIKARFNFHCSRWNTHIWGLTLHCFDPFPVPSDDTFTLFSPAYTEFPCVTLSFFFTLGKGGVREVLGVKTSQGSMTSKVKNETKNLQIPKSLKLIVLLD